MSNKIDLNDGKGNGEDLVSARNLTRAVHQVTLGALEKAGAQKIGMADLDSAQRAVLVEALRWESDGWATWVFAAEPNGRRIVIARLRPNQRELALPGRHVIFGAGFVKLDRDGADVHFLTHDRFGHNPAFADAVTLAGEWLDHPVAPPQQPAETRTAVLDGKE